MVGNPVDDYAHALLMAKRDHVLELLESTELRVDALVIADAIWRIHGLDLSYRVDRHEPYHIGTQSLDRIKMLSNSIE